MHATIKTLIGCEAMMNGPPEMSIQTRKCFKFEFIRLVIKQEKIHLTHGMDNGDSINRANFWHGSSVLLMQPRKRT
jgi:hypothetical protein